MRALSWFLWAVIVSQAALVLPETRAQAQQPARPAAKISNPREAVWQKRSAEAIAMLEADPKWITHWFERQTLLHSAAQMGDAEVVRWLLDHGADVNATAYNNFTPLHLASTPEVVELILQKKPNLAIKASYGKTAVQYAAEKLANPRIADQHESWRKIVRLMVDAGAEYDLYTAIQLQDFFRVQAVLLATPEQVNEGGHDSPLRAAATMGNLEICRYLVLEAHADVNDFRGGAGFPVILSALKHPPIVKLLIENGADLKTPITWRGPRSGVWTVGDEATVLHHAAFKGVPETIKLLIDNDVDLLAKASKLGERRGTQSVLEVAVESGEVENMRAIVTHPKFAALPDKEREALLNVRLAGVVLLRDFLIDRGVLPKDDK